MRAASSPALLQSLKRSHENANNLDRTASYQPQVVPDEITHPRQQQGGEPEGDRGGEHSVQSAFDQVAYGEMHGLCAHDFAKADLARAHRRTGGRHVHVVEHRDEQHQQPDGYQQAYAADTSLTPKTVVLLRVQVDARQGL